MKLYIYAETRNGKEDITVFTSRTKATKWYEIQEKAAFFLPLFQQVENKTELAVRAGRAFREYTAESHTGNKYRGRLFFTFAEK